MSADLPAVWSGPEVDVGQDGREAGHICIEFSNSLRAIAGHYDFEPGIDNQLLGALGTASRARIDPHLEQVTLELGDIVCEAGGQLQHVYFPEGCVLSLLTVQENGAAIETANIGREGAFGVFAAMYSRLSFNRCMLQLLGPMLRCRVELMQYEFEHSSQARNLFVSYSETLLSQVQQTVACNALHSVEERMCRWLLMMHDRAESEPLTYTHDFLADIMGSNRKSGTLAAQRMQNAGLISYRQGRMQGAALAGLHRAGRGSRSHGIAVR